MNSTEYDRGSGINFWDFGKKSILNLKKKNWARQQHCERYYFLRQGERFSSINQNNSQALKFVEIV